jgi:predicted phage tail protein
MMDRTPTLDWSDVLDAFSYEFQVAADSAFISINQSGTTSSSEFTVADLIDGKYFWRVRALNVDIEPGSWSAVRYFYIDNIAPGIPRLNTPVSGAISKGTPTYYWYAVSTGAYYQFRYTTGSGVVVYTSPEIKTTSHRPPIQAIGNYLWQVRVRDAAGNWSEWSGTRPIEIQAPIPAAPKLILPVNGTSTNDTTPLLSWTGSDYAASYEVQISFNSGFSAIMQQSTIIGATEFTPDPLYISRSTYYYWRVRSINVYGQVSSWSAYRSFKVIP